MKFNAAKMKDQCVAWIRDFFEKNGPGCNAVVGISGGKDSSIVAAMCVEALGKDRVIGVLMPNDVQPDIEYAYMLVKHLGIRYYVVNIKDAFDGLPVSITSIENVNSEFISFFMTLLAVLAFDLTSVRGAILFIMVLALFGCLFVKTELFYSNPCFAILKYHIYRVITKNNTIPEKSIVICRDKLSEGDHINKIKLSEHVFFCKKAN